jgi:hypothetical protein
MRAKYIRPNIEDMSPDDILTDLVIKELLHDDALVETMLYDYSTEENIPYDELKDEEFEYTAEFLEYFKYNINWMVEETIDMFLYEIIFDNSTIDIFRTITVNDDYINHLDKQGSHLGVYWSWDESASEAHWADPTKNSTALIKSNVAISYIDWSTTILANMNPTYQEEKEIRLFKNIPLKIKSIDFNNGKNWDTDIDISKLNNKIFKS